jgi:hypothetical protein
LKSSDVKASPCFRGQCYVILKQKFLLCQILFLEDFNLQIECCQMLIRPPKII